MNDIQSLYTNSLGMTFVWKEVTPLNSGKIQLVFKETGLFFTPEEMQSFSAHINYAISHTHTCTNCPLAGNCPKILLETPISQLSFAVSITELYLLNELIQGTLFQLQLNKLMKKLNIKH